MTAATVNVNDETWPKDPVELYVAIQERVAELVSTADDRLPVVDMVWDLLHHVTFVEAKP